MTNELSKAEINLIGKIRESKDPEEEITYLISLRDRYQQHDKRQQLHLPAPRAAS